MEPFAPTSTAAAGAARFEALIPNMEAAAVLVVLAFLAGLLLTTIARASVRGALALFGERLGEAAVEAVHRKVRRAGRLGTTLLVLAAAATAAFYMYQG